MPLVYAFVARPDGTVLADYSAVAGNFASVGQECLSNVKNMEDKFTITADGYSFNYRLQSGYVFLAVADEGYGRTIPFAYLDRLRDAFLEKFSEKGKKAGSHSLDRTFGPVLKREMEYCQAHPEEISRVSGVQRKVEEVKGIMVANVEQVLARGERLDVLVDRTDDLRDQAQKFQRQGQVLRKKMWWANFRIQLLVGFAVLVLAVVIFCAACFSSGRNCLHKSGGAPAPAPGPYGDAALVPAAAGPQVAPAAAPAPGGMIMPDTPTSG